LKDPEYVATGAGNPAVPKLNPAMTVKVVATTASAESSWRYLIDKLNQFRQARFGSKYGLSQWPEANAIRKLNGRGIKSAKTSSGSSLTPVNVSKYPRAAFGLPIIFHLPHDRLDDHSLETVAHDRLASPLILRPLLFQNEQNGKTVSLVVGLAAILDAPRVPARGLELKGKTKTLVLSDLSSDETKQILPLKGNSDVLQAFLNTL
jgi:CRISPR-associated protein Cmr1